MAAFACNNQPAAPKKDSTEPPKPTQDTAKKPIAPFADAAGILAKKQVPVLCYHHIKNSNIGDLSLSPVLFAEQMKALADSGYTTILPDQLYAYLTTGGPLPDKPVMLTFDDTDLEQYTIGATEMKKHNFKGVFFIMNIAIGKPRYMSSDQIKELSDDGNTVASHTWDHHKVTEYTEPDWVKQLDEARKRLETITGKGVDYFAYPYGLWNAGALPALQQHNIKMAFQLSAKQDTGLPLYTVRRMIVPGTWSTKGMFKAMNSTFHL